MLIFDVEATPGGPKIRCDQGHTLPVQRAPGARNRDRRRYLLRATEPGAASEILRVVTRQVRNRREFNIVALAYDGRQAKYIFNSKHIRSERAWLILATQLASGLGYTFAEFPNSVVVSDGVDSSIHRCVFVSTWLPDTQRISTKDLMEPEHMLVAIDHDDAHHPPKTHVSSGARPISL